MAAALAACGSSSSGGSSPSAATGEPTTGTGAETAVSNLYETFFSAPVPQAKTLLEDGASLGAAFKAAAKLKGNAKETVKVDSVTVTGPTTADVKYDLSTDGNVVLQGSDGKAVYVNGKWLVSKQTFCGLVELGTPNIPGC